MQHAWYHGKFVVKQSQICTQKGEDICPLLIYNFGAILATPVRILSLCIIACGMNLASHIETSKEEEKVFHESNTI